jgi:zinc and cadmium transporter
MQALLNSTIAITIVSLISLIGVFTLSLKKRTLNEILKFLVAFAVGALLGDVFIHIFPEIGENGGLNAITSGYILLGILIFFVLEKFIHWHHCYSPNKHSNGLAPVALLNLVGDGVHNILDGMIITASFLVSFPLGLSSTIAVVLHEIPQEIGDFAVLVHSGLKPKKALVLNFLSGITSLLGMLFVFGLGQYTNRLSIILLSITAGGFIYIAVADLIPELHKHSKIWDSLGQLLGMILGIILMSALKILYD